MLIYLVRNGTRFLYSLFFNCCNIGLQHYINFSCATLQLDICICYIALTTKHLVPIHHQYNWPLDPFGLPSTSRPLWRSPTCHLPVRVLGFYSFWFFYILCMSEIVQHVSSSIWLISLGIIPSKSIYVVTNGRTARLWSVQHYLQWARYGNNSSIHRQRDG